MSIKIPQLPAEGVIRTPLVDTQTGLASPTFQKFIANLSKVLQAIADAGGGSSSDDVLALQNLFAAQGSQVDCCDDSQFLAWLALGAASNHPPPSQVLSGTHAERLALAAAEYPNAIFVETDRNKLVYQSQAGAWVYVGGTYQRAQLDLAGLAATLTADDTDLLVEVTDYRHLLRWDGAAFTWGPSEDGRHDIVGLPVDPDDTTGWQLCDGTTAMYLKGDGTTGSYTTPNLVGGGDAAYLKFGTPVSGPNAAVAPTFTGGGYTPAGTVGATFTGTPANTSNDNGAGQAVQSGAGTTVAAHPHTHPNTPAGTIAATFTGTPGSLSGTIGTDGEPRNMVLRPWFRQ